MMRAPVGEVAARIGLPPAEVEVAPLRDIGHVGRLPLPEVPVEARRHRLLRERPADLVFAEHDVDLLELPDPPGPHHLHRRAKAVVAPLPRPHLHDPPRGLHSLADLLALVDRERERLLAVDVFARLDGVDEHLRVPVVRRADEHDVDPLVVEDAAVIDVAVGRGDIGIDFGGREPHLRRHLRVDGRKIADGLVDIGHRDHAAVGLRLGRDHRSLIAAADHADARAVARRARRRRLARRIPGRGDAGGRARDRCHGERTPNEPPSFEDLRLPGPLRVFTRHDLPSRNVALASIAAVPDCVIQFPPRPGFRFCVFRALLFSCKTIK